MVSDLIHDRGRGPELIGTRITVYHLIPYFLDATATEDYIGRLYDLTGDQIAAARAFVFNNLDTVLAEHLKIEERLAAGNPPEVIERAKKTHDLILQFKEWLAQQEEAETRERILRNESGDHPSVSERLPSFRDWISQRNSRPSNGS